MQAVPLPLVIPSLRALAPTRTDASPEARASEVLARVTAGVGGRLLRVDSVEQLEEQLDAMLGDEHIEADLAALSLALTLLPDEGAQGGWGAAPEASASLSRAALLARVCNDLEAQSGLHEVLRLGPRAVYENDAPPWEVMELIFAHAKISLALLALAEANQQKISPPEWLTSHLAQVIQRGYQARLTLMTSVGLPVPEELVTRRLDLPALHEEASRVYRAWDESARALASQRSAASPR